jgi:hypothetical protein
MAWSIKASLPEQQKNAPARIADFWRHLELRRETLAIKKHLDLFGEITLIYQPWARPRWCYAQVTMFEKKIVAIEDSSGKVRSVRMHLYRQKENRVHVLSPDVPQLSLVVSPPHSVDPIEAFRLRATGFEWVSEDW